MTATARTCSVRRSYPGSPGPSELAGGQLAFSVCVVALLWTLAVPSLLQGQPVTEADRVVAPQTFTPEFADMRFGSDVAIGYQEQPVFLSTAPGIGGVYRGRRTSHGWIFRGLLPEDMWGSTVATRGADEIFGLVEHGSAVGEVWSAGTWHSLFEGIDGAPGALDVFPGVIVVGMPGYGNGAGRVRVFRYNAKFDIWLSDPPLDGELSEGFGTSVALDPGTGFLLVGAPGAGDNGKVQTFAYDGSWIEWVALLPPPEFDSQSGAAFGTSLAVEEDWVAVGAPAANKIFSGIGIPADDVGAVLMYQDDFLTYDFREFFQEMHEGDALGTDVALGSVEGELLLAVGSPGADLGAANTGGVRTFTLGPGETMWTERQHLIASDRGQGDALGTSVDVFERRVVAGAPGWDYCDPGLLCVADVGSVYVFEHVGAIFIDGFETGDLSAWSAP